MKRTSVLLSALLALAVFSHADPIRLTSGSGTVNPAEFAFQFHGSGYNLAIPGTGDAAAGHLVTCTPPCDPLAVAFSPPLYTVSAPVFVLVPGDPFLSGAFTFTTVSFVSSLAPSGNLTIHYTTSLFLDLSLFDQATLLPVAQFVWGSNEPWLVTAHFVPDVSGIPGLYRFTDATLTSVPEPGTITLLGTGILPFLFGLRRRFAHSRSRSKL
jgi:hypothetical protein